MKQEKEETEKKITDYRSAAMPYAEEKRRLFEVVRDKEKNLQHIMVRLLVIYIYIFLSVSSIDCLYIVRIKVEKLITQSKAYDREFPHTKHKLKRNRQSLSLLTVAGVKNIPIRLLEFNQIWMLRAPYLMPLKSNKPSFLTRKKRAGGGRMRWKSTFEELSVNEMKWRKLSKI